ncbi:phosphatidylinositol glycan anchor biosynthesis class C [Rhodnius prolixus]|uniref:Phosphatidylinositol N-acetylglucosaminyltransferase n=1 Tax=Rhodnius prolixus TaxID=13249 RepID=T1HBP8_RHOPR
MASSKKPWKKNLYENLGYADNYTDISFLEELKKNINIREVSFKEAFLGASLVTQQLCIVVFFSLTFFHMYNEWISSEIAFMYICTVLTCSYLWYNAVEVTSKVRLIKGLMCFLLLGYLLSPVLKTLTESISTDTIYAMTVFMMAIHLVFFDYGIKVTIVSSSLSFNAAVFGSLCLASRLGSPFDAFVLLASAVLYFLMFPLILTKIGDSIIIVIILVAVSIYGLYHVSATITILYVATIIFLNLLCPVLFVRWYAYKDNIYGPWDEAIVQGIKI